MRKMTDNRRIALNIMATYGRSVYSLIIGLFCGRWTLMALGQTDYGLIGLVGGLTGVVSFLNTLLATSVGRFYAIEVGASHRAGNGNVGLENCRRWFNTALSIHTIIPILLVLIGYPLGIWAIENFLSIPADRISACIWVWRYSCLSCFIGMFTVPFQAMYTAKQEIAELTIYSFASTTFNALFLYYMVSHPGDWLMRYSAWMCVISVLPASIIAIRAGIKFDECQFNLAYWWNRIRYIELAKYSVARFWASFTTTFAIQGQAVLVNKFMGSIYNASMTVGNTLAYQSMTFSSSVAAAFWPAITNKAGEGKLDEVHKLTMMTCRIGTVMMLVFAIPLALEVHEVLRLWLVTPPPFAAGICLVVLLRSVFEKMTEGYELAIFGSGQGVMKYSWAAGWAGICTVLVAWICFAFGFGMWSICIGLMTSKIITVAFRLSIARERLGISIREWFCQIAAPLSLAAVVAMMIGSMPRFLMKASLLRVICTSVICEVCFLPLLWRVVLVELERDMLRKKFMRFLGREDQG